MLTALLVAVLAAPPVSPGSWRDASSSTTTTSTTAPTDVTPQEVPLILVENHGFPYVHLNLFFRVGPPFDPPGKEGLTAITNRLLMRGTQKRGRAALEEAIEGLGTELNVSTQWHAVGLGGAILSRHLEAFVGLLGEMLTQPGLDPEELEKVKREMIAELEAARDEDGMVARRWFRHLLYGEHPFGHGAAGSAESLRRITIEDVRAHFRRHYTRSNLLVGASGDTDEATLRALVEAALADLPEGEANTWGFPAVPRAKGRQVALIDKADRSQVQLYIGHPAIDAADPDYYALAIATTAFGGTFTARLMQEVRVKRGWSYGAYAHLAAERVGGYYLLTAAPETEDAVGTLELMFSEYDRFVREGLSDEEIEFARGYLVNAFAFSIETPALQAAQKVRAALLGRPDDFVETYVPRIRAVTPDEVRDAVRRRLTPDDLLAVMVCTAPPLRDAVAKLPGVTKVTVHPYTDL